MHGTFTTPGAGPIRFVHFAEYHAPWQAQNILRWKELVRQFRPHLAVDSGDMMDNGNNFSEWRAWFEQGEGWLTNLFMLPAYSNHVPFNGGDNYTLNLFQLPDNDENGVRKQNYSTRYGNVQFLEVGYPVDPLDGVWLQQKVSEANDGVDDPLFLIASWHHPSRLVSNVPFIEPYGGVDMILVGHDKRTEVSKKAGAGRNGLDVWNVQTAMGLLSPRPRTANGYTVQYTNDIQRTMLFVEINGRTLSATVKDWDGNSLYSFQIVK